MCRLIVGMSLMMLAFLPSYSQVSIIGEDSATAHQENVRIENVTIPSGTDRMLMVVVSNEYAGSTNYNISEVTFGGIALTELMTSEASSLTARNEVSIYYMMDSGISAVATPSIGVNYGSRPKFADFREVYYHAYFFDNVNQTTPFSETNYYNIPIGNAVAAPSSMFAEVYDMIFNVTSSGSENLTVTSTGGNTMTASLSNNIQTTGFSTRQVGGSITTTPGFSYSSNASRVNYIGTVINGSYGIVLPVSLLSFNAEARPHGVVSIQWTTATEKNSDYFLVEKKTNNTDWTVIEEVASAGNSNELLEYEISDFHQEACAFYRLTQVDIDGTATTYEVIEFNTGNEAHSLELEVYPNPATEYLLLSNIKEGLPLQIFQIDGALNSTVTEEELKDQKVEINHLKEGWYIIQYGDETNKLLVKH